MSSVKRSAKNTAKELVEMAQVQNLRLRGQVYYYHRDIPKDVQHLYGGKAQLWVSLRTRDPIEAKRLCLNRTLEDDGRIDAFRTGRDTVGLLFTDEFIDALAQAWGSDWIRQDEEQRITQDAGRNQWVYLLGIAHSPESLRALLVREEVQGTGTQFGGIAPFIADDWLSRQSVTIPRDNPAYGRLCYRIRQNALQALDALELRTTGVPVESPRAIQVEPPKPSKRLTDMIEPWKARQKPAEASVMEFERAVSRFSEKHPELTIENIETLHIVEYRDWLSGQGLAAATVSKLMGAVGALLSVAVERGIIKHNPSRGVKKPQRGRGEGNARDVFSPEDLRKLFASPAFTGGRITSGGKGATAYWLPLLGLFTGAREEELCQLRLEDIIEEGEIRYLYIRANHAEQKLKTPSSKRRIPIHPELVRIGFLGYVQTMRDAGREWLFPLLEADTKKNRSGNWSKWFGRYLRDTVGITNKAVVFHSLRHTFKYTCRACGIPEDVHDALSGHTNATISRKYGSNDGYPLSPLNDAMARYQVYGLNLSSLKLD